MSKAILHAQPSSSSKKRKHRDEHAEPSAKKSKKDKERKHQHKHKHAQENDQFTFVQASLVMSIPPVFASNPAQGVEEMLDSMVMRYIPTLRGVVLTHSNLQFLESKARIQGDSPFAVCDVAFDATVWSPRVGQRLTGKINLCSPDHVSLLVYRTFNVSIPRHHIPQDQWIFEYGPAENDPEYGTGAASLEDVERDGAADVTMEEDVPEPLATEGVAPEGTDSPAAEESEGRWTHTLTGSPLGGESGTLEFTVVGMTIANQMLSLVGSIQLDPFSPEHVAPAQHVDATRLADLTSAAKDLAPLDDSEPEDIFAQLGHNTDRMAAEARQRDEKRAEKKRRKKETEGEGGEKKGKKDTEGAKKRKDVEGEEPKPRKKKKKHEDK